MPRARPDTSHPDDELEAAFPGCVITHLLTIGAGEPIGIAIEVLQAVRASGGVLAALRFSRRGDRLDYQVRVTGLRPQRARLLCNHLSALPGVERATVEHQITRVSSLIEKL